ncbi:MAG TPA: hypothetical protein VMU95_31185 [Trebonia sp.]|nr:hypothetical protein [Trebonia sp.]
MAIPATWKCSSCGTMNSRHSGPCMACGAAEATASAKPAPAGEAPTTTVTIAPPPLPGKPAAGTLTAGLPSAAWPAIPAAGTTPSPGLAAPATKSFGTRPATGPRTAAGTPARPAASAPPAVTAPLSAPTAPAAPSVASTRPTPTTPARTPRTRPASAPSGARKFAVGKLLGVGHIGMWVLAFYSFLWDPAWGRSLLAWARNLTVSLGHPVSGATIASWQANRIIVDSGDWLSHLPWGTSTNFTFVLAIACLVVRLSRRLPGWLSLVVALPASVYGLLGALSYLPGLLVYWPLSLLALVVSWITVAKTIRRY